ncbi:MAG: ATP-binding cassette domain-containing protein [Exilispira sp.]|jgi:ABC-type nitrate/sulfonate/bicarbonate transport system ATPase subunit|nr:ATP-binding cassette domain-containing protein [Exilispira sp.]
MNAVEVKSICKSFGKNIVIKNLSFDVKKGDKIAIFAPSGSGKTTLLNILSGIDLNFTGNYNINLPFSVVFQESRLFPYMTVIENILFGCKLKKITITDDIYQKIENWLNITSLKGYEKYYPYELSGGMKAKVSLIRAFIVNPEIILLDEPFKSIDIYSKQRIIEFIRQNYPDITMILVTHNIDELPLIGGKILQFSKSPLENYNEITIQNNITISEIIEKIYENN